MSDTIYSDMESRELVELATCREDATELEVELAQRLDLALDMMEELNE
jgi:hypothetical protein